MSQAIDTRTVGATVAQFRMVIVFAASDFTDRPAFDLRDWCRIYRLYFAVYFEARIPDNAPFSPQGIWLTLIYIFPNVATRK
jgi:hypothetical protein